MQDRKDETYTRWNPWHKPMDEIIQGVMKADPVAEYQFLERLKRGRDDDLIIIEEWAKRLEGNFTDAQKAHNNYNGAQNYFLAQYQFYVKDNRNLARIYFNIAENRGSIVGAMANQLQLYSAYDFNLECFQKAAEKGNAYAQYQLYLHYSGQAKSSKTSQYEDDAYAQYHQLHLHSDQGKSQYKAFLALRYLGQSAHQGYPPALSKIAQIYHEKSTSHELDPRMIASALGQRQEYEEQSFSLLEQAAAGGEFSSMCALGKKYYDDLNYNKAAELFHQALECSYSPNMILEVGPLLSLMYYKGLGVEKNVKKSGELFRQYLQAFNTPHPGIFFSWQDHFGVRDASELDPYLQYQLALGGLLDFRNAFITLAKESPQLFNSFLEEDLQKDPTFWDKLSPLLGEDLLDQVKLRNLVNKVPRTKVLEESLTFFSIPLRGMIDQYDEELEELKQIAPLIMLKQFHAFLGDEHKFPPYRDIQKHEQTPTGLRFLSHLLLGNVSKEKKDHPYFQSTMETRLKLWEIIDNPVLPHDQKIKEALSVINAHWEKLSKDKTNLYYKQFADFFRVHVYEKEFKTPFPTIITREILLWLAIQKNKPTESAVADRKDHKPS